MHEVEEHSNFNLAIDLLWDGLVIFVCSSSGIWTLDRVEDERRHVNIMFNKEVAGPVWWFAVRIEDLHNEGQGPGNSMKVQILWSESDKQK